MINILKTFLGIKSTWVLVIVGFLIVSLLSAVTIQTYRVSFIKKDLAAAELLVKMQTELISSMEETQQKIISVTSELRKQQTISANQRAKNQRELKTKLDELGLTSIYTLKLRCLELASGSKPIKHETPNEFCPHLYKTQEK